MTLRDYFLLGLSLGLGKKIYWMNRLFFDLTNDVKFNYPLEPYLEDERMYFNHTDGTKVEITDYVHGRTPLHFRDSFILEPNDLENYRATEAKETTYGNVYANWLCLVLPFGDHFPFKFGTFDAVEYEQLIVAKMQDDPTDRELVIEPGNIYVWQYLMFTDHVLALTAFADGLVTTTTIKSLQAHPDRRKIRDEWLVKNKHRLTDPAATAELAEIMQKLDNEWLKGDASAGYYKVEKKVSGSRRKQHYFFGAEAPFSDGSKVDLIPKSLEEGIDIDKIPTMNSAARAGSFDRGGQTALGGSATKTMYRMAGTIHINSDDCGTHLGLPTAITNINAKDLIDYAYVVNDSPEFRYITADNIDSLIGKTLNIRSPVLCKSDGKNVCKVCVGKRLSENPSGIPAAVASMGGVLMLIFMKGMHSNDINTRPWDFNRYLN